MSLSILDDSEAIIRRFFVAVLFHKSKCVLHRRYLSAPNTSESRRHDRYIYSRKACVEHSLKLLEIQKTLNGETRAGARLYAYRWKVSAVMQTDFLLGTTILCVSLDQEQACSGQKTKEEIATRREVGGGFKGDICDLGGSE